MRVLFISTACDLSGVANYFPVLSSIVHGIIPRRQVVERLVVASISNCVEFECDGAPLEAGGKNSHYKIRLGGLASQIIRLVGLLFIWRPNNELNLSK